MRVLAGAHETNLDELKTIITLVLTFNIVMTVQLLKLLF